MGYPSNLPELDFSLFLQLMLWLASLIPAHVLPVWMVGIWGTTLLWILFCTVVGVLAAMSALGGDQLLRLAGLPRRWIWAAAIATTTLLPATLFLAPAALHPGRYLAHPHSVLSLSDSTVWADGRWSLNHQTLNFEWRTAPGIREAPERFELSLPDFNLSVRLGDGPRAQRVGRVLELLWLAASLLVLVVIARGFVVISRRRRRARRTLVAGVPVEVSDGLGPAVIGLRRLSIVLPQWSLTMDAALRRQMLLHEGQHIRAGDPYLLLFAALALVVMPWNLALWWQIRRLRLTIEIDCDRRVLRATGDPEAYGALLLEVGRRVSRTPVLVAPLAHPFSLLEGRIRAMGRRFTVRGLVKTLVGVCLAVVAVWLGRELGHPAHRQPYEVETSPWEMTTRNAEFQLRSRTLTTRLLQEWSRTIPAVRAYLEHEHPEVFGCIKMDIWDVDITAEDGGRLLAVRGTPLDWKDLYTPFELGTAFLPPIKWGTEYPDLMRGVLREFTGRNDSRNRYATVLSPSVSTLTYRVVAPASAPAGGR